MLIFYNLISPIHKQNHILGGLNLFDIILRVEINDAYKLIEHAILAGRPAHGYLIVGLVRGMAAELAERVLRLIYPQGDLLSNPDIHRLYPEMKSRIISVEAIRSKIIAAVDQTAFAGGWKAGIIYGADRLKKEAANAFLKTLEEPPPQTIFLLLTEQPEQLLPTIISRCQRIDLPDARSLTLAEPYRSQILGILANQNLNNQIAKASAGNNLANVLATLKKKAEEIVESELEEQPNGGGEMSDKVWDAMVSSRYREFRNDFCAAIMSWFRDLMAVKSTQSSGSFMRDCGNLTPITNEAMRSVIEDRAAKISLAQAFSNIEAVEAMATSFERNMPELPVISFFTDRAFFGA